MSQKPSHSRKRTPRSSIAPPVHPKHRSLLNEEAEALQRFWNSQRTLPHVRVTVETHFYARSKSTPNSTPSTPMQWTNPDSEKVLAAKHLLQLLKKERETDVEEFDRPKKSIDAPMRRGGPRVFPQWSEDVPPGFGPTARPLECRYSGKRYQVLSLSDALEILTLKHSLRL